MRMRSGGMLSLLGHAYRIWYRVVFMDQGAIVEDRPTQEFFDHPESDRAQDFLSKILHH